MSPSRAGASLVACWILLGCDATRPVAKSSDYKLEFRPASGSFPNPQTVEIRGSGAAEICYTTSAYLSDPARSGTCVSNGSVTLQVTEEGTTTLRAVARTSAGPGEVQTAVYVIHRTTPVPSPVFSVSSGAYSDTFSVALTCALSGSRIHYTRDGSVPTTSSSLYTGRIAISASDTIRAMAVADGRTNSAISEVRYAVQVASPSIRATDGTDTTVNTQVFSRPQTVTLSSATPGARIYYTRDGSSPTTSSTRYTGPFPVDANDTILAIAARDGLPSSYATWGVLAFRPSTPAIASNLANCGDSTTVAMTDSTDGASIRYTTDGTYPTALSPTYSGPFRVGRTATITAVALKTGWNPSATSTTRILSGVACGGMARIPAGTFTMGCAPAALGYYTDQAQHSVTLSSFWMDTTDVTQADYLAVMGTNPSFSTTCGSKCPVTGVSWFDAVLYCNARSKLNGLDTVYRYSSRTGTYGAGVTNLYNLVVDQTSNGYRLPTEAQWEYAARAGSTTAFFWGDDTSASRLGSYAWYARNNSNTAHPVATKLPNAWRLYDMSGNVWQWTGDWYNSAYPSQAVDPVGPSSGVYRVVRGMIGGGGPSEITSAKRGIYDPSSRGNGFRCVAP